MSSKRGRKRNDNLPPNRARDVQRAFRARRAAHLEALEQRVSELEEENDCLRQALNLPPANRPLLGKGPTGKDKPKLNESAQLFSSSRDSSSADADSPTSTRTSSLSPSAITASMPSRSVQVVDATTPWEPLVVNDHADSQLSTASPTFQLPPMSAPLPSKPFQYPSVYHSPPMHAMSPAARHSISGPLYTMDSQTFAPQSEDRPMSTTYGSNGSYMMRMDGMREQQRQPDYSYHQSPYDSHTASSMSAESPPATAPAHSQSHLSQRESYSASLAYPHRRSQTEPQYTLGFSHLPPPPPPSQNLMRPQSPLRLQENGMQPHSQSYPRHATYAPDGRLDSLS